MTSQCLLKCLYGDVFICGESGITHICNERECQLQVEGGDHTSVCPLTAQCYNNVWRADVPTIMSLDAKANMRRLRKLENRQLLRHKMRDLLVEWLGSTDNFTRANRESLRRFTLRLSVNWRGALRNTTMKHALSLLDYRALVVRWTLAQHPVTPRLLRSLDVSTIDHMTHVSLAFLDMIKATLGDVVTKTLRRVSLKRVIFPLLCRLLGDGIRDGVRVLVPPQKIFAVIYDAWNVLGDDDDDAQRKKRATPQTRSLALYRLITRALVERATHDHCFCLHDYVVRGR